MTAPQPDDSMRRWPSTDSPHWTTIATTHEHRGHQRLRWIATADVDGETTGRVALILSRDGKIEAWSHTHVVTGRVEIDEFIDLPAAAPEPWTVQIAAEVAAGPGKVRCQTWELRGYSDRKAAA